jgi:hypothetical protein
VTWFEAVLLSPPLRKPELHHPNDKWDNSKKVEWLKARYPVPRLMDLGI